MSLSGQICLQHLKYFVTISKRVHILSNPGPAGGRSASTRAEQAGATRARQHQPSLSFSYAKKILKMQVKRFVVPSLLPLPHTVLTWRCLFTGSTLNTDGHNNPMLCCVFFDYFLPFFLEWNCFAWIEIAFCLGGESIMNKAILGSAHHFKVYYMSFGFFCIPLPLNWNVCSDFVDSTIFILLFNTRQEKLDSHLWPTQ